MSRNGLPLVLAGVLFLALLLMAPDILLVGGGLAWWWAHRTGRIEAAPLARAAMAGGVAARLLLAVLAWSSPARASALGDYLDALLFSPTLSAPSLLIVGLSTLLETLALGYGVTLIVPRLPR